MNITVTFTPAVLEILLSVLISVGVLAAATTVQLGLKLTARRDGVTGSAMPQILTRDDAVLWNDWTSNILLAFGIFAIQTGNTLTSARIGVLIVCLFLGLVVLPLYVRWFATNPVNGTITTAGLRVSNTAAFLIILVALLAGVELFQ